jgi:hypothetical protein
VLRVPPGLYTLEATFNEDSTHLGSKASRGFTIAKMPTQMSFTLDSSTSQTSHIGILLRAADRTPLKERTVVFVVTSGSATNVYSEITDGTGRAYVPPGGLVATAFTVSAYFGQPVPNQGISLSDPLYAGSTITQSLNSEPLMVLGGEQAWLEYSDLTAPGATSSNAGLKRAEIFGTLTGGSANFGPGSILARPGATSVTASVFARVAGQNLAIGSMLLRPQANDSTRWRGEAVIDGTTVQLHVDWGAGGSRTRYHVWIYPPVGSGPLYNSVPALLNFEMILGTGPGERPAGGTVEIGGTAWPWVQQNGTTRVR